MHVIAAKAVCFGEAMRPEFADYQGQVVDNSRTLSQELGEAGLRIVSGGTDNHLLLVDLTPLDITGKDAEEALERVGIVANKNAIPYDTRPPRVTSGLRLGTPAVTSRGFKSPQMKQVSSMIVRLLSGIGDERVEKDVREEVGELTSRFPVPGLDS
jgi:glycine hydroxymethyltransferase